MKQINNIRKTVCIMANELKKSGYSQSNAFRKAWKRVKNSMTVRVTGVTAENRQERLNFLKQFNTDSLRISLEREPENKFDTNAVKVIIHITKIHRCTLIGYIPKLLAKDLSKVIDKGVAIHATLLQIIGGYSYKETLGVLINITI